MIQFIKEMLEGWHSKPPIKVVNTLLTKFPEASSIQWDKNKDGWEALFYLDNIEHSAEINSDYELVTYKINLPINLLPLHLAELARAHGEIMNVVVIYTNNVPEYEIIVRDNKLIRYLVLCKTDGTLINKEKL